MIRVKKSLHRIAVICIAVLLLATNIPTNSVYAAGSTKTNIKGKSTFSLSSRYNLVKTDYDAFIDDPELYDWYFDYGLKHDFDYYYDVEEYEWVHKPSIKEFYNDIWQSNLDNCSWGDIHKSSKSIDFTTKRKMCFIVPITVTVYNLYSGDEDLGDSPIKKGGVRIKLENDKGELIQNDFINLKGYRDGDTYEGWFYSDGGIQKAGNYTYTFSSSVADTDFDLSIKCSIIGYTKYSSSAKMQKKASTKSGKWVKIGKLGVGIPLTKKEVSSNKGVVPYLDIDANGNVYAYGRKKGTSNITVTLKNGKKYKTKVTVKAGDPNFEAYLTSYKTRDNYFTIKVKNNGASPVTFIRKGSKVVNVDYKSFDRTVKSGKNVTVKPGKSATIKFYLKGSNTWYDYTDYTLFTKIKYEGKTYECHIWDEDSSYKRNKKWWTTYWS